MASSFFKILPPFRVPALHQTLHRYLLSVQPFVTPCQYQATERIVLEFGKPGGLGERLQQDVSHMYKSDDWFHKMWLESYFLKDRRPHLRRNVTAIGHNQHFRDADDSIGFAARLTAGVLDFKHILDTGALPQEIWHGQPLCMMQYYSLFNSCRVPDTNKDSMFLNHKSLTSPRHIIVASNNHFYSVDVLDDNGIPLEVDVIYERLQYVNQTTRTRDIPIGLLTAENRNTWSEIYKRITMIPVNKQTIDTINKAIFVLCLDGEEDVNETKQMHDTLYGLTIAGSARNFANRWFDKTIQMYVGVDGKVGAVYEHAVTDGSVRARMLDHALKYAQNKQPPQQKGSADYIPRKLQFQLDDESLSTVSKINAKINQTCDDVQLAILEFRTFGKSVLKSHNISPDGFIQMAIQLTNNVLLRRPVATSESAMLRRFSYGRVEVIRSVSNASNAFVHAMNIAPNSNQTLQLLLAALESHRQYTNWAVTGNAVDRHLLALKHMALERSKNLPEFFQDFAYTKSTHFTVLSSQVNLESAIGTCFAPEYRDGNSVCYNLQDNHIYFTVSSFASSVASANEYARTLENSLRAIKYLLDRTGMPRRSAKQSL